MGVIISGEGAVRNFPCIVCPAFPFADRLSTRTSYVCPGIRSPIFTLRVKSCSSSTGNHSVLVDSSPWFWQEMRTLPVMPGTAPSISERLFPLGICGACLGTLRNFSPSTRGVACLVSRVQIMAES